MLHAAMIRPTWENPWGTLPSSAPSARSICSGSVMDGGLVQNLRPGA
jgi:hypothetical protein